MNKVLTETLERQKKLMGILNEATGIIEKLVNIIDEYLTLNKKFFSDIHLPNEQTQFLQNKKINNLEELRAAISSGLKKGLTHDYINGLYKNVFKTTIENAEDAIFDPVVEKILPDIFNNLTPANGVRIFNEYNLLKSSADNVKKLDFLNRLKLTGASDPLLNFVKRTLNITEKSVTDSVKWWDGFFRGLKISAVSIPGVGKIPVLKKIMMDEYMRNLKPFKELENTFIGLVNEYKAKVLENPLEADKIVDKMTTTLDQMALVSGNNMKVIYNNWKEKLPKEAFETLGDIESSQFKEIFSKFQKGAAKVEPTEVIVSRLQALKKLFTRLPYNDAKWHGFDKYFFERLSNITQRIGGLAVGWDARKLSEHARNLELLGGARWTGKGLGDRFIQATILWPAAIGVYTTAAEYAEGKWKMPMPGVDRDEAIKHIGTEDSGFSNLWRVFTDNVSNGFLWSSDHFTKLQGISPILAGVLANVYAIDKKDNETDESYIDRLKRERDRLKDLYKSDSTKLRNDLDSLKRQLDSTKQRTLDSIKNIIPTPQQIDTSVDKIDKAEF